MDLDTLLSVAGGGGFGVAVAYGMLRANVNTLKETVKETVAEIKTLRSEMDKNNTYTGIMWNDLIKPALQGGFVMKGNSIHLTEKGNSVLGPGLRSRIDDVISTNSVFDKADPAIEVIRILHEEIQTAAEAIQTALEEKQPGLPIVYATVQAYVESKIPPKVEAVQQEVKPKGPHKIFCKVFDRIQQKGGKI